jgi:hypothetical protein
VRKEVAMHESACRGTETVQAQDLWKELYTAPALHDVRLGDPGQAPLAR